jgi:hypothetical protein
MQMVKSSPALKGEGCRMMIIRMIIIIMQQGSFFKLSYNVYTHTLQNNERGTTS